MPCQWLFHCHRLVDGILSYSMTFLLKCWLWFWVVMENQHVISIKIWGSRYRNAHHPQLISDVMQGLYSDFHGNKLCTKNWSSYGRLLLIVPMINDMFIQLINMVLDLLTIITCLWTHIDLLLSSQPWYIGWNSFHCTLNHILENYYDLHLDRKGQALIWSYAWSSGNPWYVTLSPDALILALLSVMIIGALWYLYWYALSPLSISLLLSRPLHSSITKVSTFSFLIFHSFLLLLIHELEMASKDIHGEK